jgi:Pentapeptide repeats (8 copies)
VRVFNSRARPEPWATGRGRIQRSWIVPFFAAEWGLEWVAYFLSNWKFLEVLEYMGSLSVLVAVLFYFSESGDRTKQRHYQAWQVINTAQGKGGSGGRIEALQELNADRVPLVGVDVSGSFLQGVHLENAHLVRATFSASDLRNSDFHFADFTDADLKAANFRDSNLTLANFNGADLQESDLNGSDLSDANLAGAKLDDADLRGANLNGFLWREIRSIKDANIDGVKNAPPGFVEWAIQQGAVRIPEENSDQPPQQVK